MQDIANDGEGAVPLGRQPFLKWLRVDIEIRQKLTAIEARRRLQLGSPLGTGQTFEVVEVGSHVLEATISKVRDKVLCSVAPQRLAQLQQTIAQAVPRLLRSLIGPQQVGQPLAADCLAALSGQISEQGTRLLWQLSQS